MKWIKIDLKFLKDREYPVIFKSEPNVRYLIPFYPSRNAVYDYSLTYLECDVILYSNIQYQLQELQNHNIDVVLLVSNNIMSIQNINGIILDSNINIIPLNFNIFNSPNSNVLSTEQIQSIIDSRYKQFEMKKIPKFSLKKKVNIKSDKIIKRVSITELLISLILSNEEGFVKAIGYFYWKDSYYVVSKRIEGISLSLFYLKSNIFELKIVFRLLIKNYYRVHQNYGYYHADFHPGNIIVDEYMRPIIIDYDSSSLKLDEGFVNFNFNFKRVDEQVFSEWVYDILNLDDDLNVKNYKLDISSYLKRLRILNDDEDFHTMKYFLSSLSESIMEAANAKKHESSLKEKEDFFEKILNLSKKERNKDPNFDMTNFIIGFVLPQE